MQLSKKDSIIKDLKSLLKNNTSNDLFISLDLNGLSLALKYNLEIESIFYANDIDYHKDTQDILNKAILKAFNKYEISYSLFQELSLKSNSIGFIALIKANKYTYNDFKHMEFLVVCDKLEIPGNLGTIYRTIDSTNVDGLLICDAITKYNNNKVSASSRDTNSIIPTISDSYENIMSFLINNNYDIYLGEPLLGKSYQDYDYKGKVAIVVGNERFGINEDWYNHPHKKVYIPMEGNNNSLNVGVACSILTYEAYMKRRNQ